MKTVTLRMVVFTLIVIASLGIANGQTTQPIRTALTTNNMMNAPIADGIVIWNAAAKLWSNGVNVASSTNLPSYLTTSVLTNLAGTGLSVGATNASAYIASQSGRGTNTQMWGVLDVGGTQTNRSTLSVAGLIGAYQGVAAYDSGFASYDGSEHLTLTAGSAALDSSLDPLHISWNGNWFVDFSTNTSVFHSNVTVNGNLIASLNLDVGANVSIAGSQTNQGALSVTGAIDSWGGITSHESAIYSRDGSSYVGISAGAASLDTSEDPINISWRGNFIARFSTNTSEFIYDALFDRHVLIGQDQRYYLAADSGLFYLFDNVSGSAPLFVRDVDSIVGVQAGLTVPAIAYGPTWDGSTLVPTMDAVYDKIESLSLGSGGGGAGSLPMDSSQFTTNTIVTIKNGALLTNISVRGLTIPSITASRVAVINSSGNITNSQNVDLTEIEYLDGVTSAIQTQLNAKLSSSTNANQFLGVPLSIKDGALLTNISSRGVTLPNVTASRVAVYNSSGNLTNSQGVDLTEIEFLDGVTSAIQGQFAAKLSSSTNANQFSGVPLSIKNGALVTNIVFRGLTDLNLTASRPAYINASGNLTNASGTPDGTKFMRDDGVLAVPAGSGTNFSGVIITNAVERTVLNLGSSTNPVVPWGTTNRIVWSPASNAGFSMSGNPGQLTNEQIIHLTVYLTNSAITSVVCPTNGIDGLPPFFIAAPSTNEFDLIYNGFQFYIASGQVPSTGTGPFQLQTNSTAINQTIRYVPLVVSGVGGANTNFTLSSTDPEKMINGFTNVSIRASMGYDPALVDYWNLVITNGSGSNRTLEFSAVTNRWRFAGTYGTNAPSVLTNATRLLISARQHGTNVQVGYTYFAWP